MLTIRAGAALAAMQVMAVTPVQTASVELPVVVRTTAVLTAQAQVAAQESTVKAQVGLQGVHAMARFGHLLVLMALVAVVDPRRQDSLG
jgi:L,D-peptidoglycan transpeptidase YkuD (ErfK/YbiS/YcfS/YnhG family)